MTKIHDDVDHEENEADLKTLIALGELIRYARRELEGMGKRSPTAERALATAQTAICARRDKACAAALNFLVERDPSDVNLH